MKKVSKVTSTPKRNTSIAVGKRKSINKTEESKENEPQVEVIEQTEEITEEVAEKKTPSKKASTKGRKPAAKANKSAEKETSDFEDKQATEEVTDSEKVTTESNEEKITEKKSEKKKIAVTPKKNTADKKSSKKEVKPVEEFEISTDSEAISENDGSMSSSCDESEIEKKKAKESSDCEPVNKKKPVDSSCSDDDSVLSEDKMKKTIKEASSDSDSSDSQETDKKGVKSEINKSPDQTSQRIGDGHTIFIKGFGKEITELHIEEEFSKFGNIKSVRMPKDNVTGSNKGFCFVEFENASAVPKALQLNGTVVFNCQITVDNTEKTSKTKGSASTLFVKNLPFNATEQEIEKLFKKFNPVEIRMPLSEEDSSRNRGYAFIEFSDEETVQKAMNKNWSLGDKKLFTDVSMKKNDKNGRDDNKGRRDFNDRRGGRDFNDKRGGRDFGDRRGGRDFNDRKGSMERRGGRDFNNRNGSMERRGGRDFNDKRGGREFNDRRGGQDFNDRKFSRDGDRKRQKENSNNKKIVFNDSSDE
ncbi:putative Nucleotide-binding, alpha-beta plait, RNA recognition motif domain protein [Pseudoloma neurophilia]|uniref:Putative Nucleotide-binding, alpha-beta plait, RNA recognition motif domain protein n=1 Tax=Pseudoloma neurophilia TaxID=146866 RepID=A0A0R0M5L4_9MICR|nr:putative Nucleotide-binding, alpha-beta plait, RNA recognition motif domain protein [Pseudoloma neurophilia]